MHGTNLTVRRRLTWIFLLASLFFMMLIGRLVWVQLVHGNELQEEALETRMRDVPVEAKRGTIYDRNGTELVTSISVDSIFVTPSIIQESKITNPLEVAEKLAPILEIDVDELYKKLSKKSSFEWIKRKVDNDVVKQVRDLNIPGVYFVEESKRYYLNPSFASHVLGFAGIDNQGLTGLEKSYDVQLRGQAGRIITEYDGKGRKIPEAMHQYIPAKSGYDLVLTIDETIQYFVERELDIAVAQYQPKFAVAIVMDPETGGILAMGNRPTFDSNNWGEEPQEVWDRNPAVWYGYEPGSTFKIITAAAVMEEGTVQLNDRFYDSGSIQVAGERIRCWKDGGHGSQSFLEVVEHSCNPGFIEVGLELGREKFYKYINGFNFGKYTGIILPGEATGILYPEKKVTNLNLATISIGQSINVTPIQLISAVAAVANDGMLMKPQLVSELRYDGKTVERIKPQEVRQVIAKDTAQQLREILEKVVAAEGGTGSKAFVEGYRVGGKTGTAEVVENGVYVDGRYVASFAGMAPIDDPKVTILVVVAEPQGGIYYGGQVAAPIFGAIARDTLRYLGLPEVPGQVKPKEPWETITPSVEVEVPNVVNYPLEEAIRSIKAAGLQYQTNGEGNIICEQTPKAGARVKNGTAVILELQPAQSKDSSEQVTVPNLSGLTIKEAGNLLEKIGLHLLPEGSGLAVEQNIKPGVKVTQGATIKIKFASPSQNGENVLKENISQEQINIENPYN